MVICLERGADLHMFQLMPLPLTVSCFSKIQIGFTFLVPAHLGSPGQRAVKRGCVCVYYACDKLFRCSSVPPLLWLSENSTTLWGLCLPNSPLCCRDVLKLYFAAVLAG